MCGIAGIVALDGFDPKLLTSMTHPIKYRGPDGYGFAFFRPSEKAESEVIHNEDRPPRFTSPVVGLGNRRLAILDHSCPVLRGALHEDSLMTRFFPVFDRFVCPPLPRTEYLMSAILE
jgi:asparagine synthetase B (glutamine-hydrolysing)